MQIALIGLNQETATIQIRNRVAYTDSKKIEALNALLDIGIDEVIILATCSRNEIYICAREKDIEYHIKEVKAFFESFFKVQDIQEHLYVKRGESAMEHILAVTSGLDSIVLGEDQILGQVKDAHFIAMDIGSSGKILNRLFKDAVTSAKKIKTALKISEHPMSLSYIGVKFLLEKMGTFKDKRFLIIGTGEMGKLALKYVMDSEPEIVYMTNRNHQKVIDLTEDYPEIKMIPYEERYQVIPEIDVLITATASSHFVVRKDMLGRLKKPLAIMDLALPQDVEDSVGDVEGVSLFNVDSLNKISEENEQRRFDLAQQAKKFIQEDVQAFKVWIKSAKVDPLINDLNTMRKIIETDTFDYLNKKLSIDAKDRKIMEKMISSALKRMIREPIMMLKSLENEEDIDQYSRAIEELYHFRRR